MMETEMHEKSCFVTLTYCDKTVKKTLPGYDVFSVEPDHVKNWLKRLRAELHPQTIRFFLVGEYGDVTKRPHYHAALFGISCDNPSDDSSDRINCDCPTCSVVRKTWKHGLTDVAQLEPESAQYIASYTTKKLTNPNDEYAITALGGRRVEFTRMSNRPGIGFGYAKLVADSIKDTPYAQELVERGEIPNHLRRHGRNWPIGRYIKDAIREELGIEKEVWKENVREMQHEKIQETAKELPSLRKKGIFEKDLRKEEIETQKQKVLKMEKAHERKRKEKQI
jgi:hypothetical protein